MADKELLIGIIADKETANGFIIAGIGEKHGNVKNYLVVDKDVTDEEIEEFFIELQSRKDIGIIFIASDIAHRIERTIKSSTKTFPIVLEIPSKSYLETCLAADNCKYAEIEPNEFANN